MTNKMPNISIMTKLDCVFYMFLFINPINNNIPIHNTNINVTKI